MGSLKKSQIYNNLFHPKKCSFLMLSFGLVQVLTCDQASTVSVWVTVFFGKIKMRSVDLFSEIWGLATIFLSRAYLDCRRFFWLDEVDDSDFYLFPLSQSAPSFPLSPSLPPPSFLWRPSYANIQLQGCKDHIHQIWTFGQLLKTCYCLFILNLAFLDLATLFLKILITAYCRIWPF